MTPTSRFGSRGCACGLTVMQPDSAVMQYVPSVVRRLHRNVLVAVLAFLALSQPLLTPLSPDLAGRMPNHGHIYAGGVPVPHAHPGDAGREPSTARVICNLHGAPHPIAASDVGGASTASTSEPQAETPSDEATAPVFTFDTLGLFASLAMPVAPAAPACPEPTAAWRAAPTVRFASVPVAPQPQPPQA